MQMMKWSVIALAVAAGTSQMALASSQSESKGFVEDSSFDIFSRALYMNRDFKHGAAAKTTSDGGRKGYGEEFGVGIRGLFESGFTEGTVGFGIDAHTLSSIRLDTGKGRNGLGLFAVNDEGQAEDTQTEFGGAVKARISETTLKHGNQFVESPVFSTDDSRILPEVATGTYLTSSEIEGLELSAGRFTAMSSQTATYRDSINGRDDDTGLKNPGLTSANIYGVSYQVNDDLALAAHHSDVEDYWTKNYFNVNYNVPLADDQAVNFDVQYYKTQDQGDELEGKQDNTLWSLATAYTFGAHTITAAYQSSSGDTGYAYGVDGGGSIWVANSVQISDFNGEDEKSYQLRYDLDMESYGVPGLSFMTRYITADDITLRDDDANKLAETGDEHEWNFESKYVIQEGAAKDLSMRVRHSIYRGNNAYAADSSMNDTRLIVEYPLDIL